MKSKFRELVAMAIDLKTNFINEKIINILKKFMIFDSLSPEEIKQLLCLDRPRHTAYQARIAKLCQYRAGETVIQEGFFDCWSFWVVTGVFDVIQKGKRIISFSRPGEIFGEMSVLEGIPRTASVICKTGGVCLCIDMSVMDNLENDRVRKMVQKRVHQVIRKRLALTENTMQTQKRPAILQNGN